MNDWLRTLHDELAGGTTPLVRVVVARVRGSAPREAGASMIVSAEREIGTIGGGHLEFVATKTARDMLTADSSEPRVDRFSLGASLGQCCGGIVELRFERYDATHLPALAEALATRVLDHQRLWLFGAGHVGRALINAISPLPFAIRWVDSREGMLPDSPPDNVVTVETPRPEEEVGAMRDGDWALVMTHSHAEDFEICRALLAHGRFGWAGVIGSRPKANRFRQRLAQRGFPAGEIARLTMPIGIDGIRGKEPASIAVSVAAQLLQLRDGEARAARPLARES